MQHSKSLLKIIFLVYLATWLVSCGGSSSGSNSDDAILVEEVWFGSARLQQCDDDIDMINLFPTVAFQDDLAFVRTKANILRSYAGTRASEVFELKAISYDGVTFFDLTDSDTTNDIYAPTKYERVDASDDASVHDNKLWHMDFANVPTVTVGPPDTTIKYAEQKVIEGGGILVNSNGYAFLFIHDKWGCDLIIAVMQRARDDDNVDTLPPYLLTDFSGIWSGQSEEFVDNSRPPDFFPIDLDWVTEPNWELNVNQSPVNNITGGGGYTSSEPGGSAVSITGGGSVLENQHGYITGTLISDKGNWVLNGFLSPDKKYFGGFTWLEDWTGYWHDLSLVKE